MVRNRHVTCAKVLSSAEKTVEFDAARLAFTATLLVAGLLIRKVTGALLLGVDPSTAASILI